ncbi:MAG: T9SS type A sorting domain-containing protein, partial [Candidatus Goldbacteria bacterium]|nr:T9SS type A sorting domain-containing protein [Candidatus Goldiibacteriota bacterium]
IADQFNHRIKKYDLDCAAGEENTATPTVTNTPIATLAFTITATVTITITPENIPEGQGSYAALKAGTTTIYYEDISEKNFYNYPNPCRNMTVIRFSLNKVRQINLQIYTINGESIWSKEIYADMLKPGINSIDWYLANERGQKVSNGIYILKLYIDDMIFTKKIAVVR